MYYAGVAETIGVKVNMLTPAAGEGDLAALRDRRDPRRHPASRGRLYPARRPHPGAGQGRARARRRDQPQHDRHRHRADGRRRVAGQDRQGRHHLRACRLATGNFARQTGAMLGLDMPVIPVEHQYIVTEPHPAIQARQKQGLPEMGVLREADSSWYMREENGGLLLGPYEHGAPCCYVDGPDAQSRIRALPGGPRPAGAAYRDGDRARAGLRRGRHQEGL